RLVGASGCLGPHRGPLPAPKTQWFSRKDGPGNRRSWPVATGEINIEALKRDRDQLWGEVVHLSRDGVHWWPDREFEREHIRPQQEARFEPDPWESIIQEYLDPLISRYLSERPSGDAPRVTIIEIAEEVL